MGATKIEWCDFTFNPWIGCQNVSPGCDHCYAETLTNRYGWTEWGPHGVRKRTSEANWRKPLQWAKSARGSGKRPRVFCASLADVFDNRAPEGARGDLFALIRATPELDWLLLTKRPQNIRKMLPADWGNGYPNVWLGVSAERQLEADERIPELLATPAAVRFVSAEPLLGPIDFTRIDAGDLGRYNALGNGPYDFRQHPSGTSLDWIIVGGESGPNARPMHPDWARSIRDQCAAEQVPFFFKQWGSWLPGEDCIASEMAEDLELREGKKRAGRLLDGVEHNGMPAIREVPAL